MTSRVWRGSSPRATGAALGTAALGTAALGTAALGTAALGAAGVLSAYRGAPATPTQRDPSRLRRERSRPRAPAQ